MKKRIFSLLLALVMAVSLLPVSAFAEGEDYDLRVLTFEDTDYKGGTNFANGNNWSSLIDNPQYGAHCCMAAAAQASTPRMRHISGRIPAIRALNTYSPTTITLTAIGAAVTPFPTTAQVTLKPTADLRHSSPSIKRAFPACPTPAAATTAPTISPCITVTWMVPNLTKPKTCLH